MKKIKILFITLFLILVNYNTYSCNCKLEKLTNLQNKEIENSECIFIGEVISIIDNTYEIVVHESLDGNEKKGEVIIGKNHEFCSPNINSKGKWLIYGNIKNGFLETNICGISRSFEYPENNFHTSIPKLVPSMNEKEHLEFKKESRFEKWKEKNKKNAQLQLKLEIIRLRNLFSK